MEWSWIPGAVAGLIAGFFSALVAPFAKEQAAQSREESAQRLATRRAMVEGGRALVQEAYANNWSPDSVAQDVRFMTLRDRLSDEVQAVYRVRTSYTSLTLKEGPWSHELLQAEVDALARRWKLS